MTKTVSLTILAAGLLLSFFSLSANSFSAELSKMLMGGPIDSAIWIWAGGLVIAMIGLAGILPDSEKR
jgi:hypothetical protein